MSNNDLFKTLERADDAPPNPYDLFQSWMDDAGKSEINDPNAMSLATIEASGMPAVRVVLLKGLDERGFVFYTNSESDKGKALAQTPKAALCFHWKTLQRQVRIQGTVEQVSESEADEYYNSRHRGSRIGAWASAQSSPLESRTTLQERVTAFEEKFKDSDIIPRPPFWNGYRVSPSCIEFWHDGSYRLHTRVVYLPQSEGVWSKTMLYP